MPFTLAPRLKAFDYRGMHRYFLTVCCERRQSFFLTPDAVAVIDLALRRTAFDREFAVIAYCWMPDHGHVIAEALSDSSAFTEFVRIFKQRSGHAWKRATGRQLWQRSYFDRVLRKDEDVRTVVAYIINNPIRAGLVASPQEYPFWGSLSMTREEVLQSLG